MDSKEDIPVPECVEVKLAYDISVIPLLGGIVYGVCFVIVCFKFGVDTAKRSYWLNKGKKRLWIFTLAPLILIGVPVTLNLLVKTLFENQKAHGPGEGAINRLKAIVTAQAAYTTRYQRYAPTLAALVNEGLLDYQELSTCTSPGIDSQPLRGYIFQMSAGRTWTSTSFYVRCRPYSNNEGTQCYCTDKTGRILTTEPYYFSFW